MDFQKIAKRAVYAYVGAIAYAYEATKKAVDACVVKGEQTVNDMRPKGEQMVLKVKSTIKEKLPMPTYFISLGDFVDSLTEEEKDEIREKLDSSESCSCVDEKCSDSCECE